MSFHLKIINSKSSEEMSHRSRRREVESPEEQTERVSVFERLGKRIGSQISRTTDFSESDLRSKVSRKRRPNEVSPNRRSTSPRVKHHSGSVKSVSKTDDKSDNNSKVKSLVKSAPTRPESPTSTSRRSGHSSHKWEDDIDSEALEQKRLELQKQLQELEKSGSLTTDEKHKTLAKIEPISEPKETLISSRSSSIVSSESSSTLKSLTKTESSENSEKKTVKSCAVREDRKTDKKTDNKKSDRSRSHVSSSISLKSVTHSEPPTRSKSSEVKLDRHGNVRISLDELERQKRLRAERFGSTATDLPQRKSSSVSDRNFLRFIDDPNLYFCQIEPKIIVTRDNSYSPPPKRSKGSISGRHRNISDSSKADHTEGMTTNISRVFLVINMIRIPEVGVVVRVPKGMKIEVKPVLSAV